MLGMVELVDDVRLGTAELAGEFQQLVCLQIQVPEYQHLRGEERIPDFAERRVEVARLPPEGPEGGQPHPCIASSCFMRAHASGGSESSPAASASRNSSLRCRMCRADCCPPTITKWSWWPFSQAMNTTPVL